MYYGDMVVKAQREVIEKTLGPDDYETALGKWFDEEEEWETFANK